MLNSILKLPTPSSISFWWNFGSLLGVCLGIQLITGLFLSMHYSPSLDGAFESVVHMTMDVNWGWLMRYMHANGATFFFAFIYIHIGRGLYYKSYGLTSVWIIGMMMFFLFMGVAFLGYVLPWGQMSYWGATVITNLISAIPYFGHDIMEWMWGGFSVSGPTLNRFYSFHFLFPFLGALFVMLHLMFLHETGSSNPIGVMFNSDKILFHPFFTVKDLLGFMVMFFVFGVVCLMYPFSFMDPDNFIKSNPLVTPAHIQPEWYFLFAYAILRSVPSKLGGVIAMVMSIMSLLIFVTVKKSGNIKFNKFYEIFFISMVFIFVMLTWLGMKPVETPYLELGQIVSLLYFLNILLLMVF